MVVTYQIGAFVRAVDFEVAILVDVYRHFAQRIITRVDENCINGPESRVCFGIYVLARKQTAEYILNHVLHRLTAALSIMNNMSR